MSTLPYEDATAGPKALAEIERMLDKLGCSCFGTMRDEESGCLIIAFRHRGQNVQMKASWKGYAGAWLKHHPWHHSRSRRTQAEHQQFALAQARISVCSVLRDWIKGQITAIECGLVSFEEAFMPQLLLEDGRRVIDAVAQAKLLPRLANTGA